MKVIEAGKLEWDETRGTTYRPALIQCDHVGCPHTFFHIIARAYPTLCLDHAEEAHNAARPGFHPFKVGA